jgi:hypothetical protein
MESNPSFDLNAFQTSTNIDTFSNEITSSYDLNAIQTTSTVDNTPLPQTLENNAFQTEQYDLNAFQTTETIGNIQTYDIKDYQTSPPYTPSFDLNALQTTGTVDNTLKYMISKIIKHQLLQLI